LTPGLRTGIRGSRAARGRRDRQRRQQPLGGVGQCRVQAGDVLGAELQIRIEVDEPRQ
jgi:hypothetical protein